MVEFNADGSIKIPERFVKKKAEDTQRFENGPCVRIRKQVVSFSAPKLCHLHIELSPKSDERSVDTTYSQWQYSATVPSKLIMRGNREFLVEIGTDFKRCTDCTAFVNRFRSFLPVIVEKGNCTFEGRSFVYEDMFE